MHEDDRLSDIHEAIECSEHGKLVGLITTIDEKLGNILELFEERETTGRHDTKMNENKNTAKL